MPDNSSESDATLNEEVGNSLATPPLDAKVEKQDEYSLPPLPSPTLARHSVTRQLSRSRSAYEGGPALVRQISQKEREQAEKDEARQFGRKPVDPADPFLVVWEDEDDPANPLNWSMPYRWW